jgi:hypothetical protein
VQPDPRFIPFACGAVQLKPTPAYLDYVDYGAFYKKCLWVLQAIGTPEAIGAIANFAESSIPELKEQAIYRLSRIATTNTLVRTRAALAEERACVRRSSRRSAPLSGRSLA